jgi:hypothetical protein
VRANSAVRTSGGDCKLCSCRARVERLSGYFGLVRSFVVRMLGRKLSKEGLCVLGVTYD